MVSFLCPSHSRGTGRGPSVANPGQPKCSPHWDHTLVQVPARSAILFPELGFRTKRPLRVCLLTLISDNTRPSALKSLQSPLCLPHPGCARYSSVDQGQPTAGGFSSSPLSVLEPAALLGCSFRTCPVQLKGKLGTERSGSVAEYMSGLYKK